MIFFPPIAVFHTLLLLAWIPLLPPPPDLLLTSVLSLFGEDWLFCALDFVCASVSLIFVSIISFCCSKSSASSSKFESSVPLLFNSEFVKAISVTISEFF